MLAEQFIPEQAVRILIADFKEQDWVVNVPLYAVESCI